MTSHKILCDKALNIPENLKYDGYQTVLLLWYINVLIKNICLVEQWKNRLCLIKNKLKNYTNQLLINFFKKPYSSLIDNIFCADLADMQLISKFNKGFRFLLCVTDIFSKYAWVIPSNDNEGITIINAFQKNLDESNLKPNKIGLDIVQWPFKKTLTFITYRFLFHFMLSGVQEDQKSKTCYSQALGNIFMARWRCGVSCVIKQFF